MTIFRAHCATETTDILYRDRFAGETGKCTPVDIDLFVVAVEEITTGRKIPFILREVYTSL